jgi:molybdopterin-biosynthesis enzyme MoeA-like protein
MVGDDRKAIAAEIQDALERKGDLIITTGGLGPTADDITMNALAEATDHPLGVNQEALKMVKRRYEELAQEGYVADSSLTPSRQKMAHLPQGATPIFNPVGTAPACTLRVRDTTLLSLPGVPEELMGIWEGPLEPLLQEIFGEGYYQEKVIIVGCQDESLLAPILKKMAGAHPQVYIKSRAKKFGPEVKIKVTLSSSGRDRDEVEGAINEALKDLTRSLGSSGLAVEPIEEP